MIMIKIIIVKYRCLDSEALKLPRLRFRHSCLPFHPLPCLTWPRTCRSSTVSFHNFKPQTFKLSVSNPKSKYLAYLSVLSQISNCQGLGRKNKHEILKTDRTLSPLQKQTCCECLHQQLCRWHEQSILRCVYINK